MEAKTERNHCLRERARESDMTLHEAGSKSDVFILREQEAAGDRRRRQLNRIESSAQHGIFQIFDSSDWNAGPTRMIGAIPAAAVGTALVCVSPRGPV